MTLARKSRKYWYNITVYFEDGSEQEFDSIDWCRLNRNSNTLILCEINNRSIYYIRYIEVVQVCVDRKG